MMSDLSLSDVAAVTNGENGFGGNGAWAMIILFALIFGGGGFGNWGNNRGNVATTADVQRATDFQALERQNNEGVAATRQAAYDVAAAVKDGNYNLRGEIHDLDSNTAAGISSLQNSTSTGFAALQQNMASGFAGLQNAHTEILRNADSIRYDNAMNTAKINETTTAQSQRIIDAVTTSNQKVLDTMAQNKIADLQAQVNDLKMQNQFAGVVRYPNGYTYNAGASPFCGCGCNMG